MVERRCPHPTLPQPRQDLHLLGRLSCLLSKEPAGFMSNLCAPCAVGREQLHGFQCACLDGDAERGGAVGIPRIHVDSSTQQGLDLVAVA